MYDLCMYVCIIYVLYVCMYDKWRDNQGHGHGKRRRLG